MKVPPKRKGNAKMAHLHTETVDGLNESPSEKEGKSPTHQGVTMKVRQPQ